MAGAETYFIEVEYQYESASSTFSSFVNGKDGVEGINWSGGETVESCDRED